MAPIDREDELDRAGAVALPVGGVALLVEGVATVEAPVADVVLVLAVTDAIESPDLERTWMG